MTEIAHRTIETNGIRMHVVEAGAGPLVLLCHGFPESWYSWRHQLTALAEGGFRAVAPDMRGYGRTDQPVEIEEYSLLHLVGDLVGLLDALGEQTAVVAGHDAGAPVAWYAALMRPDRFSAVAALSVPFRPRGPVRPTSVMPNTADEWFYQLYFQRPGIAEAELDKDPKSAVRKMLYSVSGDAPQGDTRGLAGHRAAMVPRDGGFLSNMADPDVLPAWLTEADIDFYASEFSRAGFRGGLNWYRNVDRNWELLAPFAGAKVTVPALYIAGDRDLVRMLPGAEELMASFPKRVPLLRGLVVLPGCGHWTQQERPREVNGAMLDFLRGL